MPSLSGTDTAFRMMWAPAPGADVHGALAPSRVWTAAGYVGVWHFNAQNADGSYPDASGHGATAASVSATVPNAPTTATLSTNGTPWHFANVGLRVLPENTAGWTFSSTGYTTEAWLIPTASPFSLGGASSPSEPPRLVGRALRASRRAAAPRANFRASLPPPASL